MESARSIALFAVTAAAFAVAGVSGFSQSETGAATIEARKDIAVGDVLSKGDVHIITEPGSYGLGRNVGDSEYAVANGRLIRIDPKTLKVLSILRVQDAILD